MRFVVRFVQCFLWLNITRLYDFQIDHGIFLSKVSRKKIPNSTCVHSSRDIWIFQNVVQTQICSQPFNVSATQRLAFCARVSICFVEFRLSRVVAGTTGRLKARLPRSVIFKSYLENSIVWVIPEVVLETRMDAARGCVLSWLWVVIRVGNFLYLMLILTTAWLPPSLTEQTCLISSILGVPDGWSL